MSHPLRHIRYEHLNKYGAYIFDINLYYMNTFVYRMLFMQEIC
jgi:hypothetical protein